MNGKSKQNLKLRLIEEQRHKCCYCSCDFSHKKWETPTLEHVEPKCYVGDKTKFKASCKRCNLLKGNLSEDLFLSGYICVNYKYTYNGVSVNEATKVRGPLRWYHKKFPKIFNWNKKHYNVTCKMYDI